VQVLLDGAGCWCRASLLTEATLSGKGQDRCHAKDLHSGRPAGAA
jgi:hypothetical protein